MVSVQDAIARHRFADKRRQLPQVIPTMIGRDGKHRPVAGDDTRHAGQRGQFVTFHVQLDVIHRLADQAVIEAHALDAGAAVRRDRAAFALVRRKRKPFVGGREPAGVGGDWQAEPDDIASQAGEVGKVGFKGIGAGKRDGRGRLPDGVAVIGAAVDERATGAAGGQGRAHLFRKVLRRRHGAGRRCPGATKAKAQGREELPPALVIREQRKGRLDGGTRGGIVPAICEPEAPAKLGGQ